MYYKIKPPQWYRDQDTFKIEGQEERIEVFEENGQWFLFHCGEQKPGDFDKKLAIEKGTQLYYEGVAKFLDEVEAYRIIPLEWYKHHKGYFTADTRTALGYLFVRKVEMSNLWEYGYIVGAGKHHCRGQSHTKEEAIQYCESLDRYELFYRLQ